MWRSLNSCARPSTAGVALAAADSLCEACVTLFGIDAAALSLVFSGVTSGTFGSSDAAARAYDELQFTIGEGPCLDSVATRAPVLVPDLAKPNSARWPLYRPALLDHKIRGVFAIPVVLAGEFVGALDLFKTQPGELPDDQLAGAVVAAELAGAPLLDLIHSDFLQAAVNDPYSSAWADFNALSRTEVSQATGMLVANSGSNPPRRWYACAPTPTPPTAAPPRSPATFSTGDCDSKLD